MRCVLHHGQKINKFMRHWCCQTSLNPLRVEFFWKKAFPSGQITLLWILSAQNVLSRDEIVKKKSGTVFRCQVRGRTGWMQFIVRRWAVLFWTKTVLRFRLCERVIAVGVKRTGSTIGHITALLCIWRTWRKLSKEAEREYLVSISDKQAKSSTNKNGNQILPPLHGSADKDKNQV